MALLQLDIQHLRNIEQARLEFSPTINLIIGPNASGKTSLLEAISLICQGRSFRTNRIDQLIQHGQPGMLLVAHHYRDSEKQIIGLSRENKKTQVKINGQNISKTTELAGRIPLFVLIPESHELLDSGPKMRRQYLDWGVFHVEHQYLDIWKQYHRILRQRNSALRRNLAKQEIQAWDQPLVEKAERLHQLRQTYIDKLSPILANYGEQLIGENPKFDYQPGWDIKNSSPNFVSQLNEAFSQDQERGFTRLGPHRADIKIKISGKAVQTVFSRGQQKLLICAMTLAQLKLQPADSILLVDDLPAELDPYRRAILLDALKGTGAQVFVTATEPDLIDLAGWSDNRMFHVKHGSFQDVV